MEEAAAKLAKKTPNVKVISTKADVGKEGDVKAAVDKAVSEFGRLDIMVRLSSVNRILMARIIRLVVQQRRRHAPRGR